MAGAAIAARHLSLSLSIPDCPCHAGSRTPSPLPATLTARAWSPQDRARPLPAAARSRRVSAPDLIHAAGGTVRGRRLSWTGEAHADGKQGHVPMLSSNVSSAAQPANSGHATRSGTVAAEEELQWWDECSEEERSELRSLAVTALREWEEMHEAQGEEPFAVRDWLPEEAGADAGCRTGPQEGAQHALHQSQVVALYRAFKQAGGEPVGEGEQVGAPSRSPPQTQLEAASAGGLGGQSKQGQPSGVSSLGHQQAAGSHEETAGGGNWLTRTFSSVDARLRGLILLNLLAFLYGSNVSVLKNSVSLLDPATFAAGRFGIGSLAFLPWLGKAVRDPRIRKAGGELGLWASTGYLTQAVALQTSDAGRVSFISTFTVIVVPLLAGLFGKKISPLTWVSAAAALAGVGLLESSGAPPAVGDLWALVSAVLFGLQMLRTEHHSRALRKEDSMALIALQLTVTAAASALWALLGHLHSGDLTVLRALWGGDIGTLAHGFEGVPWWPMLYTGVFSTALCLWIEVVSLHDVSATEAALVYTVEPLWGAGFAWLLLGERWGPLGFAGAALILGGSLTTQFFGKEEQLTQVAPEQRVSLTKDGTNIQPPSRQNFDVDKFREVLSSYAQTEASDKLDGVANSKSAKSEVVVERRTSVTGIKRRTRARV